MSSSDSYNVGRTQNKTSLSFSGQTVDFPVQEERFGPGEVGEVAQVM